MTPEDAIEMIDRICKQVSLSREGHDQLKAAVQMVRRKITPEKEKEASKA